MYLLLEKYDDKTSEFVVALLSYVTGGDNGESISQTNTKLPESRKRLQIIATSPKNNCLAIRLRGYTYIRVHTSYF